VLFLPEDGNTAGFRNVVLYKKIVQWNKTKEGIVLVIVLKCIVLISVLPRRIWTELITFCVLAIELSRRSMLDFWAWGGIHVMLYRQSQFWSL